MESENGQLVPASLQDIRFVLDSGDEMVVVLTTKGEQALKIEQQLDDVGT